MEEVDPQIGVTQCRVTLGPGAQAAVPLPRAWLVHCYGPSADVDALRAHARQAATRLSLRDDGDTPSQISRSYRYPYALIAVHSGDVGVDIERVEPYDLEFARSICTPEEWKSDRLRPRSEEQLASLWSTKEALAKALGNAMDYDPRRLVGLAAAPRQQAGSWQAASVAVPSGHVGWVVWRRTPAGRE